MGTGDGRRRGVVRATGSGEQQKQQDSFHEWPLSVAWLGSKRQTIPKWVEWSADVAQRAGCEHDTAVIAAAIGETSGLHEELAARDLIGAKATAPRQSLE
jgi:hypothetical protein